jgi:hypothetical protein
VSIRLRIDYKYNYEKIKEKNNINNNKYFWEVEFRGSKSREKYRSKYGSNGALGNFDGSLNPRTQPKDPRKT